MQDKFAVIGLGLIGTGIAKALAKKGAEVIAIDTNIDKVESMKDEVAHAVALDATDLKALKSQNIMDCDAVVVAIGHNFEGLLLTTVLLREMGIKRVIARASNKHQKMILEKVGCTDVFTPDESGSKTGAEMLIHPDVKAFLRLPDTSEKNGEKKSEEHLIGVPKGDTVLLETDILILIGKSFDVDKFIEINK